MPGGFMNPSYGAMMEGAKSADVQNPGPAAKGEAKKRAGNDHLPPHIHIHSHSGGHTVHIMHHDGTHEKHEHPHGDHEGIAQHIHTHLGPGSAPESTPIAGADEEYAEGER